MKRKILCFSLALMICMLLASPTYAVLDSKDTTRANSLTGGLTLNPNGQYSLWGRYNNGIGTHVTVKVILEKNDIELEELTNSSDTGVVFASKAVTLSAGSYTVTIEGYLNGVLTSSMETTKNVP